MEELHVMVGPDYLWSRVRVAMLNIDIALALINNGDTMSAIEKLKLARAELQALYDSIQRYEISIYMDVRTVRRLLELARYADVRFDKLIELFIRRGVAELESKVVAETGRMPADADPC